MTTAERVKIRESLEFVQRFRHFLSFAEAVTFDTIRVRRPEALSQGEKHYLERLVKKLTEELA